MRNKNQGESFATRLPDEIALIELMNMFDGKLDKVIITHTGHGLRAIIKENSLVDLNESEYEVITDIKNNDDEI